MLKRRTFWITFAIVLLGAVVGVGAMKRPAAKAPAATAQKAPILEFLPADLTEVTSGEVRQTLRLSGALRAVSQAAVKAKVAGEVREVLVREGEPVKAGQVLIRIDPTEYQARVEQARGSLMASRGQLDIATKSRDNNQALVSKGFISQTAFDNAASQYDIARANLESAKGAFDVAQKALNDTVIRAPISGLVAARSVQPGEKVSVDNRLLDVVDLRQMEMEAAVPTADLAHVKVGQEVTVSIEGLSNSLAGRVARINPATQAGSRSVLVYIQVDNPDGALRIGMFGEAQLTLAKKENVLTVPQTAVRSQAGADFIYVVDNGSLKRAPVVLGLKGLQGGEPVAEVANGIAPGTRIVKNNLGTLIDGTAVRMAGTTQK